MSGNPVTNRRHAKDMAALMPMTALFSLSARSSPANQASATSALVLNATASIFGWWDFFA